MKLTGVGVQLPWITLLSPEERAELRAATVAPSDSDVSVRGILGQNRVRNVKRGLCWRECAAGSGGRG